jgi:hypothetical protein
MPLDMSNFVEVKELGVATHFLPLEKKITEDITIGGMYQLICRDGDVVILDDVGLPTTCFMWNHGKFYKLIK